MVTSLDNRLSHQKEEREREETTAGMEGFIWAKQQDDRFTYIIQLNPHYNPGKWMPLFLFWGEGTEDTEK